MGIFFVLLWSCGEKTTDTSTSSISEEPTLSNGDCAYFDEEQCNASQECTPLMASPLIHNEENTCWIREEPIFAECMSIEMGCGQGIIHARGPQTECMMFPNMCIPINWHICTQEFPECVE